MKTALKKYWVVLPMILCLIFGYLLYSSRAGIEEKELELKNLIARTTQFETEKGNIAIKLAEKQKDLDKLVNGTCYLKKIIKNQNEKIKLLAEIKQKTEITDLSVPIIPFIDSAKNISGMDSSKNVIAHSFSGQFDTTDQWFKIQGNIDSSKIFFSKIQFFDELQFIMTEKEDSYIKGYFQNKNPFSKIDKFNLNIELESNRWNWWSFGVGIGFLTIIIMGILLIK